MLVLVLDLTQCLPQGAGALPAMMQDCMTGSQKNWGPGPPEGQDKVETICTVPLDCGTPTTRRLYLFGVENIIHPKYLSVTLDKTLSYKQHIINTKMATHTNLLNKSTLKWGTNEIVIRTTAWAL